MPQNYLWSILTLSRPIAGEEGVTRHNWMEMSNGIDAKVISDNGKTVVLEAMHDKERFTLKKSKAKNNGDGSVYTAIINKKTHFAQRPEGNSRYDLVNWKTEDEYHINK